MSTPRTEALRVQLQVLGIWAVALFATVSIAATTRLGPVVLELSPTHGVHFGDVLAAVTCGAWAADTAATLRARHHRVAALARVGRRR